ncbi:hypothetical protein T12_7099 [Trichinella patagoniensis]|uniref:Uncharacterized protein n=1 Tax=Trichinella patagoniensis TaxID=990121 RepID=A0A0V0YUD4_9BILA|nr:hypothetical protein T12_7099 [Trichinella patagoniensis]
MYHSNVSDRSDHSILLKCFLLGTLTDDKARYSDSYLHNAALETGF